MNTVSPTAGMTAQARMRSGLPDVVPADARDEIERFVTAVPAGAACVATGSLVEGLGNENSDIDLYIIQPDNAGGNPISIGIRKSRYVDCEYLSSTVVSRLVERFANPGTTDLSDVTPRDFDRYYRMSISVPMVADDAMLRILDEFTQERSAALFSRKCSVRAYHFLARAAVAAAAGDDRSAHVLLREAWLHRSMKVLADAGEGYPSTKWTEVKAARRFGAGSAEYTDCLYGVLTPSPDVTAGVAAARDRIPLTLDVQVAFPGTNWQFADGVREVPGDETSYLIRGKSIAQVSGVTKSVIGGLNSTGSWREAHHKVATGLSVPEEELQVATSGAVRELVKGGYLTACSAKEE